MSNHNNNTISTKNINRYLQDIAQTAQRCGCDGKMVVASYGQDPATGEDLFPKVKHFKPDDVDGMQKTIENWTQEQHRNVYMPLCLMRNDLAAGKKGGLVDVVSVFGFCADFDDQNAKKYADRLPLKPDMVLETSKGRYQPLFLPDRPVPRDDAVLIAANLQKYSGCDFGTKDICHVWRVPGTFNYPNKKKVDEGRTPEPQIVKMITTLNGSPTSVDGLREKLQGWVNYQKIEKAARIEQPRHTAFYQWNGDIGALPLKEATKSMILSGENTGYRSEAIMTVLNGLVYSNLTDSEIFSVFHSYAIGDKFREKKNPEKWLQPQIEKARARVIEKATQGYHSTVMTTGSEEVWESPVPLNEERAPDLNPSLLPGTIGDMARAVSIETETPFELASGLILSVIATAIHGKLVVNVKPGYTEPLNLWVVTALDPANRKSSVLMKITAPLNQWETTKGSELDPWIKETASKLKNQESRVKSLRAQYGKAKQEDLKAIEQEIADIENNLIQVPAYPKIWAQDVTPEHLGTLLNKHSERMAILSAEGGIFDIIGGRYSNGVANLDLFLQSHSGDPVRVDRGSREPVSLNNPALSLGLSPQPEVLRGLIDKPGFRGKGLLARILYFLPQSNLGYRGLDSESVSENIKNSYQRLIFQLLEIEPGEDDNGNPQPYVLHFSKAAYQEWSEFYMVVEKDLREGGRFEYITDWAGKLPGAAARIAGVLHSAKNPNQPWTETIDLETMENALGIAATFADHALIAFDLMGADRSLEQARKVWRWIEHGRFEFFTKRDCFHNLQGTFQKVANIEEPLSVLAERNYIRAETKKTGGRPSIKYHVNPEIIEGWS